MSARSKSSSSSIRSNGSQSNFNNNLIRTSQPPITRPLASPTFGSNDNSSSRNSHNLRSSHPSKKSVNSSFDRSTSSRRSSLRKSTTSTLNSRASNNKICYLNTSNGRRSTFSFGIKSYLNDPTCISLRNQLMGNNEQDTSDPMEIYDECDDTQLQNLVSHLKEYEQQNAINENYIEASKAHHLTAEINEVLKIRKKNEVTRSIFSSQAKTRSYTANSTGQSFESDKQNEEEEDDNSINSDFYNDNTTDNIDEENDNELVTMNQMKEFDQFYQKKINQYQEDTNKKISELKQLHKQQIECLETIWREKKPPQYRKPSAQLLQLKTIEKKLAITGDYERAMILHKETESLKKQEMADAQKKLVCDYKSSKSRLQQKQIVELEQLEKSRSDGLTILQNEHKLKRLQYENRDKVIQQQKIALASKRLNMASHSLSIPAPILAEKTGDIQTNLLPELIPPNDPNFIKEEEKKSKEENKRRLGLQQKNIDAASHYYKLENTTENENSNDKNSMKNKRDSSNKNKKKKRTTSPRYTEISKEDNDDGLSIKDIAQRITAVIGENDANKEGEEKTVENNNQNENSSIINENEKTLEENNDITNIKEENKEIKDTKEVKDIKEDINEETKDENKEETKDNKEDNKDIKEETKDNNEETKDNKEATEDSKEETKDDIKEETKDIKEETKDNKEETEDAKEETEDAKEETKDDNKEQAKDDNKEEAKDTKEETKEETKDTNDECKESNKEKKEEYKEETNSQNENEQKVGLDISLLNSLVGSADPQSSEASAE